MNLKPFVAWCLDHGITSPLEIKQRDNDAYRYTVLKREEEDNKNSIADENGLKRLVQCPLASAIVEPTKEELADRLQFERQHGAESKFAPYIDILPQSFDDLPRFWDLSGIDYDKIPDGGKFRNEMEYHRQRNNDPINAWAMACVDSRANVLPNGGGYAMTPLLDMINHNGSIETRATIENDALSLFAHVPKPSTPQWQFPFGGFQTKSDVEVKISYGPLTNLQTLIDYGFVESNNPHHWETISVSVIRKLPVSVRVFRESIDRSSICDVLTSLSLASEELDYIVGQSDVFQSRRNEIEVYGLILGHLEEAIEDFTSITEPSPIPLISLYIQERQKVLQSARDKIVRDFPELAV